jgi:peptidylprolyl isomerase
MRPLLFIPILALDRRRPPSPSPRPRPKSLPRRRRASWKAIPADDLLVMELKDGGRWSSSSLPISPRSTSPTSARWPGAGWWEGSAIYRVQDNYVVQWGKERKRHSAARRSRRHAAGGICARPRGLASARSAIPTPMRARRATLGWPVGYDPFGRGGQPRPLLRLCRGRPGLSPDTGTGGELYAVIGHAPRHLDRNIAVVGRVIAGSRR